jgi:hypothetical protein
MAERPGISMNALWSRVQRIRGKLKRCIKGIWKMNVPASMSGYFFAAYLIAGVYIRSVYSLTIRRALKTGAEVRIASLIR